MLWMKGLMERFGTNAWIWKYSIMWIMQGRWSGYSKDITIRSVHIAVWDTEHLRKLHQSKDLRNPRTTLGKPPPLEMKHLGEKYFCLGSEQVLPNFWKPFDPENDHECIKGRSLRELLEIKEYELMPRNNPWPKNGWKNNKILKITVDLKMGTRHFKLNLRMELFQKAP